MLKNQYGTLRLALFSGKGGVGKTTLSCGFALHWAQQFPNETILLVSTDPAHSLGDVLQVTVEDTPHLAGLPNLQVRALDAQVLLQAFKARYGAVLELLVERGSFVQGEDLTPVWDLGWPGLDELMGILEIQRILREQDADRVVVDMAPSGHTLNLFGLMDFLDQFLDALNLFQEKHRTISHSFTGRYTPDDVDAFLAEMKTDLATGRQLLQDAGQTACGVVAIAEPMSYLETRRFLKSLNELEIPVGGLFVNRLIPGATVREQQELLGKFIALADAKPVFKVPFQRQEPVGSIALDELFTQIEQAKQEKGISASADAESIAFPTKLLPSFGDFVAEERRLILVGGKGGVGKTTVAAAIAWGMAERHPDSQIRVISIDPAHSLADALGMALGHEPVMLTTNLSGQEVEAEQVLDRFREDYLWELAEMMSGETNDGSLQIAYSPQAWRQIVSQALPGIDEMLSLITVMDLLERGEQDLIILDMAPTGHLLRFLEMPMALGDWLAWIFKLWIKYQDVVGRTEFMGRLRSLRQRVMQAQKKLKDPKHTEFIGVLQAQSAIIAETERLTRSLSGMNVSQRYSVHNRFEAGQAFPTGAFEQQTIVRLPQLPRAIDPLLQIKIAAKLIF
ncbi:MAG: ArsA family ATPase [Cyanobacteria bacterium CRU_2_1]|nr:ArsA family ATPase [Cyanobacteria bacterium CRU_2_1]